MDRGWRSFLFCGICLFAVEAAHAADIEGYHFADGITLFQQKLVLNGIGVRAVSIFKGYYAALYVGHKTRDAHELLGEPGAKRISMRMLLATNAETFVRAVDSGARKDYGSDEMTAFKPRIDRFDAAMRGIGSVHAGDVVDIDYLPGQGTRLMFNGKAAGGAIEGADFYVLLLKIFIGEHPIDQRLKRGMLGLQAS